MPNGQAPLGDNCYVVVEEPDMFIAADWRIGLGMVLVGGACAGTPALASGAQVLYAPKPERLWTAKVHGVARAARAISAIFPTFAFHPEGRTIAAHHQGQVEIREVSTGEVRVRFRAEDEEGSVCHMAFSPNGRLLAVACDKLKVGLFDPTDGKQVGQLLPPRRCPSLLAFSRNGKYLTTYDLNGYCYVFEVASGKLLHELRAIWGPFYLSRSLAFSPRSDILSWLYLTGIRQLDLTSNRQLEFRHIGNPSFLHYSPDGRHLLVRGDGATVCMIEADTGKVVHCFLVAGPFIDADQPSSGYGEFSPDGKYVITTEIFGHSPGKPPRVVRQWDTVSGKLIRTLQAEPREVKYLSFSADNKLLAVAGDDDRVNIFDLSTGKELTELRIKAQGLIAAVFCPDGRHIALWSAHESGARGEVTIWSLYGKPAKPQPAKP